MPPFSFRRQKAFLSRTLLHLPHEKLACLFACGGEKDFVGTFTPGATETKPKFSFSALAENTRGQWLCFDLKMGTTLWVRTLTSSMASATPRPSRMFPALPWQGQALSCGKQCFGVALGALRHIQGMC